ncbi:hypothetical protein FQN60_018359 [Etheostoma spectabile]|uniref:Uncharacterized protein n=1 Tax=Etheostoma spectabile TaxID=54343 RepID=A0A5J5DHQ7_9PERO|nr:hypothetical protein FQN60_018359 [Etheostoma spectabile]
MKSSMPGPSWRQATLDSTPLFIWTKGVRS